MTFAVIMNTAALDATLDGLSKDAEEAARPASQAGAQVLYNAVEINVSRIGHKTGRLANAIYQAFSKDNSGEGYATYHISWNAKKAPHGHLVEFGHLARYHTYIGKDGRWYTDKSKPLASPRQVAARPFIRPAMASFEAALQAMQEEWFRRQKGIK